METNPLIKFDPLKSKISTEVLPYLEIKVSDVESQNQAQECGKHANKFAKSVEAMRVELTKPLLDEKKRIDDYAKSILEPVNQVVTHLKKELSNFEAILRKQREEAARKAALEQKKREEELAAQEKAKREQAEFEASLGLKDEVALKREQIVQKAELQHQKNELAAQAKQENQEIESMRVKGSRVAWNFEIENADLVPREFMSVDDKKIRAAIKDGAREIKGVRIFEETKIAL